MPSSMPPPDGLDGRIAELAACQDVAALEFDGLLGRQGMNLDHWAEFTQDRAAAQHQWGNDEP